MPDYSSGCFLVGAFSLKEKSPTITVGSFFSADNLTLNGPLFLQFLQTYNFSISYNSYLAYEVVFLHHLRNSTRPKGTPLEYFRLCETFIRKFFSTEGSPLSFFTFSRKPTNPDVPKGSPFGLFFENFLMSPKGPPSSFLIFCNGMYVNKSRRVPLLHLSALCDFFERKFQVFFQKMFCAF